MATKSMPTASKKGFHADLEEPKDSDLGNARDRELRWMVSLGCIALILGVPTWLVGYWCELVTGKSYFGNAIGLLAGGSVLRVAIRTHLFVFVKEWHAYVTQDLLTGDMVPYGPGVHPSFPWEQRNKQGTYPLTAVPVEFELPQVKTATSAIHIKGRGDYAISLKYIRTAIAALDAVDGAFLAFPKAAIIKWCSDKRAETISGLIQQLNEDLADEFIDAVVEDNKTPSFEKEYGFKAVSLVITEALLTKDVQATLDSLSEAEVLFKLVAKTYGYKEERLAELIQNGDVTIDMYNKMLNRVMAISKQGTKLNVQVIEGELPAVVAGFLSGQRSGGTKPRGGKQR